MRDIVFSSWDRLLDFTYASRFVHVHSLLLRIGLWLLMNFLALSFFWHRWQLRSPFYNAVVVYFCSVLAFSTNFGFLQGTNRNFYFATLIISALAIVHLVRPVAFFFSPQAGTQQLATKILWGVITVLFLIQLVMG